MNLSIFGIGRIFLALPSPELDYVGNVPICIQRPTVERAGDVEIKDILNFHK